MTSFTQPPRKVLLSGVLSFATVLFAGVNTAYALTYEPLVALPGVEGTGQGLGQYLNQLYMATVAIGAILAFLKIAFAGAKWSLSEVVTDKGEAKKDIQGALLGLAILLIPFIVLNTIYPNLTKLNILENAGGMQVNIPYTPTAAPPTPGSNPAGGNAPQTAQQATQNLQNACNVRPGSIPPPGCPGAQTADQTEIARLCAQTPGGGVWSASTNTCIRGTTPIVYRTHLDYTMTEQLRWAQVCGNANNVSAVQTPGSGELTVSCI